MSLWLSNTDGRKDAMLTLAVVAFVVILLKLLLAGVTVSLGEGKAWALGGIDAGVIAALLTPTLGAYVARRYTDAVKK